MEQPGAPLPDDNTLVIGEGVVLDLEPANVGVRILSALIDLVITYVVFLVGVFVIGATLSNADDALAAAIVLSYVVAVLVGLPATVETLTRGRSVGKFALGVRVVRDDGGPIRARHAVIRALVGFFELYLLLGSPAVICSLLNRRSKRLGDLLAGSYVLRERRRQEYVPPVHLPTELAQWAHAADIGRIPDELAMTLRMFLSRLGSLTPYARAQLAADLHRQLLPLVAPPPPPGTHPERFLAAVVAERRDRELRRYQRERAANARLRQAMHL